MTEHHYKGIAIQRCIAANADAHGGRWAIRTAHEATGLLWVDEECIHVATLAEARQRIGEILRYGV